MDRSGYVEAFIEEAKENLEIVNKMLLQLEEGGYDDAAMNEAYRILHTIKGTAGVVGVDPVQACAHIMEDLLDVLRKEKRAPAKELLDIFFQALDTIERMIKDLETEGTVKTSPKDIIAKMKAFDMNGPTDASKKAEPKENDDKLPLTAEHKIKVAEAMAANKDVYAIRAIFEPDLKMREGRAYQLRKRLAACGDIIFINPTVETVGDETNDMVFLLASNETESALMEAAMDIIGVAQSKADKYVIPTEEEEEKADEHCSSKGEARSNGHTSSSASIRVKSKLLDQMLDLVGEIMINNIRINQIANDLKNRELKQSLQNNSRLMTEMQDIVLRTRMVQVDFIFKRFPRMVRDVGNELGKDVEFTMRGNDIEIDRGLLDEIGDALVHLLRNSIDHGIESPETRVAAGKKPKGSLILSAFQEQSNIVITVEDDGKGIDPQKIAKKAIEKGLVTAEEVAKLDDKKIINFVFLPGFSTAEKITGVSGRGVGMDVVRSKIEGMGGFVKIESEAGKGTKMTLKLPPSMSIIRAMLVEINHEKYAIPLENVRETVKVPLNKIHDISSHGVFRLREEVLPVLNVQTEFGGGMLDDIKDMPAIIVEKNENRACLLVSKLIGQQEIVVKNVGRGLRSTGYFSGATILGDGKVAMILDVGAFI
ncbi:MAG TPA: chemotaxis protein CheA [Methanomassiliicoccales archaeon]|nr:chemotaxis protein CheA [Methanomassiliicoccales archaeon]